MKKTQAVSAQLIQALFDSIPDAIYFKDRKGHLVLVNKAHAAGLGLKPQDVVGKTDFDFFPKDQAQRMTRDDRQVMRTEVALLDILEQTTRPDGSQHYVSTTKLPRRDQKGKIVGIMGITRDTTGRTTFEKDRYRILFETSQNCIYITTREGYWVDINEAGVKLFGYKDKKEFLKTKVVDIYADVLDRRKFIKKIEKENFVDSYEIDLKRKDGSIIHTVVTAVVRRDRQGKIVGYQGTILDITHRKQMEEALKELPRKIIEAQEEERKHIAREIHDDLGQSLAILKMLIQATLLHKGIDKNYSEEAMGKVIDYLNEIINKSRHLASGLRPSTLEVLGLSTALKMLVDQYKNKKDLKINLKFGKIDQLHFKGEVINLYRIIQEALTNVIMHAAASRVDIVMKREKDRLFVRIQDNGRGLTYGLKNKSQSSRKGIGLSTMEERAKLLGGGFHVKSKHGKGTLIFLEIPVLSDITRKR